MEGTCRPDLTCAICWSSSLVSGRAFINREDKSNGEIFEKFCQQISQTHGVERQGDILAKIQIKGPQSLLTLPGVYQHFSFCQKCFLLLKRATERRDEVAKVEARVLELQRQELRYIPQQGYDVGEKELQQKILTVLKELKGRIAAYFMRIRMIAEVINNVGTDKVVPGEVPVTKYRGDILRMALELKLEPTPEEKLPIRSLTSPSSGTSESSNGNSAAAPKGDSDSEDDGDYDQNMFKASAGEITEDEDDDGGEGDSLSVPITADMAMFAVSAVVMDNGDSVKSKQVPAVAGPSHAMPSTSSSSRGDIENGKPQGNPIKERTNAFKPIPKNGGHLKELKPLKCSLCPKRFAKNFQRRLHRLSVHNV